MQVLLVYAHPEPTSFNAAMRDVAVDSLTAAGNTVDVVDLYAEGFNPVAGPGDVTVRQDESRFNLGLEQMHAAGQGALAPDVQMHLDKLLAADFLLLQFPMWWFSLPAILKGWIDRVFVFGAAYDFGRTWENGVFAGRRAMLSITASAPEAAFPAGRSQRRYGAGAVARACGRTCALRLLGVAALYCVRDSLRRRRGDACGAGSLPRATRAYRCYSTAVFPYGRCHIRAPLASRRGTAHTGAASWTAAALEGLTVL